MINPDNLPQFETYALVRGLTIQLVKVGPEGAAIAVYLYANQPALAVCHSASEYLYFLRGWDAALQHRYADKLKPCRLESKGFNP